MKDELFLLGDEKYKHKIPKLRIILRLFFPKNELVSNIKKLLGVK